MRAGSMTGGSRPKEAAELFVQVMETSKRVLGEEHLDTLSSMGQPRLDLLEARVGEGGGGAGGADDGEQ